LVPLRDAGQIAQVALGGVTTLRVSMNYGDVDYLMLIPSGSAPPVGPRIDNITISGDDIVLEWTGDGTVQKTTSLPGTGGAQWEDVSGASPLALPRTGQTEFYRLKDETP
jgi:hypothetical protein